MESVTQEAATAIYAALSRGWGGRGGKHLSSLTEEGPAETSGNWLRSEIGYAPGTYDEKAARKL